MEEELFVLSPVKWIVSGNVTFNMNHAWQGGAMYLDARFSVRAADTCSSVLSQQHCKWHKVEHCSWTIHLAICIVIETVSLKCNLQAAHLLKMFSLSFQGTLLMLVQCCMVETWITAL